MHSQFRRNVVSLGKPLSGRPQGGFATSAGLLATVLAAAFVAIGSPPANAAPSAVPFPPARPVATARNTVPFPPDRPRHPEPVIGGEEVSLCQRRLAGIALWQPVADIVGPGACGAQDVVRLDAVILKDGSRMRVAPAAVFRCAMAEQLSRWVRDHVVEHAAELGSPLASLITAAAYECRGRNRVLGAKISEHGYGNAIDLAGFTLASGAKLDLTDPQVSKTVREKLRDSSCGLFTTVLGPGSDGYHEKHIHLDLAERRSGARLCRWEVR